MILCSEVDVLVYFIFHAEVNQHYTGTFIVPLYIQRSPIVWPYFCLCEQYAVVELSAISMYLGQPPVRASDG